MAKNDDVKAAEAAADREDARAEARAERKAEDKEAAKAAEEKAMPATTTSGTGSAPAAKKPSGRFSEMNDVLNECVKEVEESATKYRANQKRIGGDQTKAIAGALTEKQIEALAKQALSARSAALNAAALAAVAGAVAADKAKGA